jgi:hypothetical protein
MTPEAENCCGWKHTLKAFKQRPDSIIGIVFEKSLPAV